MKETLTMGDRGRAVRELNEGLRAMGFSPTEATEVQIKLRDGVDQQQEEQAQRTRKKAEELCIRSGIPIIAIPEGMIEEATGKSNMLMGLQKGSFTEEILARETKTDKP